MVCVEFRLFLDVMAVSTCKYMSARLGFIYSCVSAFVCSFYSVSIWSARLSKAKTVTWKYNLLVIYYAAVLNAVKSNENSKI